MPPQQGCQPCHCHQPLLLKGREQPRMATAGQHSCMDAVRQQCVGADCTAVHSTAHAGAVRGFQAHLVEQQAVPVDLEGAVHGSPGDCQVVPGACGFIDAGGGAEVQGPSATLVLRVRVLADVLPRQRSNVKGGCEGYGSWLAPGMALCGRSGRSCGPALLALTDRDAARCGCSDPMRRLCMVRELAAVLNTGLLRCVNSEQVTRGGRSRLERSTAFVGFPAQQLQ